MTVRRRKPSLLTASAQWRGRQASRSYRPPRAKAPLSKEADAVAAKAATEETAVIGVDLDELDELDPIED